MPAFPCYKRDAFARRSCTKQKNRAGSRFEECHRALARCSLARYAQRIYVMYAGRIVESGTTLDIFSNPRHPYTVGLLKSVPRLGDAKGKKLVPIEGLPPNLIDMPPACAFLPRCSLRMEACYQKPQPPFFQADGEHTYRCYSREELH